MVIFFIEICYCVSNLGYPSFHHHAAFAENALNQRTIHQQELKDASEEINLAENSDFGKRARKNTPPRKIRVGLYENKPKIFTGENGESLGIFIGILEEIARRENWQLVYVPCKWSECLADLEKGRIDLMPDVAVTPERKKLFDFHQEAVIIGYSELALHKVDSRDPLFNDLKQIFTAAERSKDITRQLLSFARKETVTPEVLDLNVTVKGLLRILQQLIGEDIKLVWKPGSGLWPVLIDAHHLDQILANLCINARDAISGAGEITVETGAATFDNAYCSDHAGFVPGNFVFISVSDNGSGMDNETLNKIFEPFFTTKEIGHGTGLGLATVYGIVKQNHGFINVDSEPGKGTTFRVYLPGHMKGISKEREETVEEIQNGNGETLLVVEDEISILTLAERILTNFNYRVLTAKNPSHALKLTESHVSELSLLITDLKMPEMNGKELAKQVKTLCPKIRCLYISGYPDNVPPTDKQTPDEGFQFLDKPFSAKELINKVRSVLDERNKQL